LASKDTILPEGLRPVHAAMQHRFNLRTRKIAIKISRKERMPEGDSP
jgi:hypothetical protein